MNAINSVHACVPQRGPVSHAAPRQALVFNATIYNCYLADIIWREIKLRQSAIICRVVTQWLFLLCVCHVISKLFFTVMWPTPWSGHYGNYSVQNSKAPSDADKEHHTADNCKYKQYHCELETQLVNLRHHLSLSTDYLLAGIYSITTISTVTGAVVDWKLIAVAKC